METSQRFFDCSHTAIKSRFRVESRQEGNVKDDGREMREGKREGMEQKEEKR